MPPPDAAARRDIFVLKLKGRPTQGRLDLERLVKLTDGFSGADVEAAVNAATDLAIEASLAAGAERPIENGHLLRAVQETRPSARPWIETARNYALYANEGGVYDELLELLRRMSLA